MVQLKNKTYNQHESDGIISYDTRVKITKDVVIVYGKPSAETFDTVTTSEFHISTEDFISILRDILGDLKDYNEKKLKPGPGSDKKWKAIFANYEINRLGTRRIHLYQCVSGNRWGEFRDTCELWSIEQEIIDKIQKDNPNL